MRDGAIGAWRAQLCDLLGIKRVGGETVSGTVNPKCLQGLENGGLAHGVHSHVILLRERKAGWRRVKHCGLGQTGLKLERVRGVNRRAAPPGLLLHAQMSPGTIPIASTTQRAIWPSLEALRARSRERGGDRLSFRTVLMFSAWASETSPRPVSPGSSRT